MKVSILSYGASPLGGVFDPADPEEGIRAVHYAIDHGVNYFDVAPMYGVTLAEKRLGVALKGKRDKVFLATKCGRYDVDKFDFSYKRILASIDESLQRLQTDYVDVYQLHDIEFVDKEQVLNEAVPAAMKVKEQGKARFFGITGLPVRYLAAIAREVLLNASPLLQRILSDSPIPEWHRSPQEVKDVQPQLLALCEEYGVNVGDVANRYAIDHPDIATTIVGMSKFKNIERNIKVLDFKIPDGLLEKVMEICNPVKNRMWFEGRPENNIPKPDSEGSV
jgi:L-galactose dehydrogenase